MRVYNQTRSEFLLEMAILELKPEDEFTRVYDWFKQQGFYIYFEGLSLVVRNWEGYLFEIGILDITSYYRADYFD